MRVIHRGTPPEERLYRTTCSYCKSVLEESGSNLSFQHCQREGSWASAKCPVCGQEIMFSPPAVQPASAQDYYSK